MVTVCVFCCAKLEGKKRRFSSREHLPHIFTIEHWKASPSCLLQLPPSFYQTRKNIDIQGKALTWRFENELEVRNNAIKYKLIYDVH